MKKKIYSRPKTKVFELKTRTILMTSGFETKNRDYKSGGDETWDYE